MDKLRLISESRPSPIVIHIPGEGDKVTPAQDVYYIEIMDKRLTYHCASGDYETRGSGLKQLENELAGSGFCRCSSSYLVNLRWCREIRGDEVLVAGHVAENEPRNEKGVRYAAERSADRRDGTRGVIIDGWFSVFIMRIMARLQFYRAVRLRNGIRRLAYAETSVLYTEGCMLHYSIAGSFFRTQLSRNFSRTRLYDACGGGKFVIQYAACAGCMILCFDCGIMAASFCATIGYSVQHISQRMTQAFMSIFSDVPYVLRFVSNLTVCAVACFAIWYFSIRRQKSAYVNIRIESPVQLIITAVMLLSTVFIEMQFFIIGAGELMVFEYLLSSICAFMAIIVEINILSNKHMADVSKCYSKCCRRSERITFRKDEY